MRLPIALLVIALAILAAIPAQASHADGSYDVPVWFQWEKVELDIYIVPPPVGQLANQNGALGGDPVNEVTPLTNSYLRATEDSIANWQLAIDTFGPAWLKSGLDLRGPYVLGRDVPETTPLQPADILIVFDVTKANILGVAISTRPCIVDNSMFLTSSFSYQDMWNINGQEFGHCIGLNHVLNNHPRDDVMNGLYDYPLGSPDNPLKCVSNLDVEGLEGVFARVLGQPSSLWGAPGTVSTSQYATVPC